MSEFQAIRFRQGGSTAAADCLELTTIPKPTPEANDLLVRVKACAVNPVDTKIRAGAFPAADITGFDAAGIVEAVGSSVQQQHFQPGQEVYFSGQLGRPGSTAQYTLVDHRLAALKPSSLDWPDAACVPLVTLTAWELLEEHFGLAQGDPSGKQSQKSIIIINGAGGVGSVATQLAARVFKLGRVIVTASRPETIAHARRMGATHVLSHHDDLKRQLQEKVGVENVNYIFICYDTNAYLPVAVDIAAPKGRIGSIVETTEKLDGLHAMDAFMKQLSFHWEVMLSKGALQYDLESQGDILARAAKLYDEGVLTTLLTASEVLSVKSLIAAHEKLESGKAIGKLGFVVPDRIE